MTLRVVFPSTDSSLMDFLCVCVRIPKAGSTSLHYMLQAAFGARRNFYIPHTLNLDAGISRFQDLRFVRSRARHLASNYRTLSMRKAFRVITENARDGDLLLGGHIDFPSVKSHLPRRVKMITMFRAPAERCRSEYQWCRETYLRGGPLRRVDSSFRHKAAGKYSFDGYLDFLLDFRDSYADIAARYVGWDGKQDIASYFSANVFHSGLLEDRMAFQRRLSDKMGVRIELRHHNAAESNGQDRITCRQRRKIEQIYPRDFSLYEWHLADN